MASSNWTESLNSLETTAVDRGVTAGIAPPLGGGSFVYGFNSVNVATGAVGRFANQVDGFAPMAKGGSIRGAVKRGVSGGNTGFAPFLMIGLQGTAIADRAYILGLGNAYPHHIVLAKGRLLDGLPDLAPDPAANGVLRRSAATFNPDVWHHLRLDMVVNGNGDVILKCFANDLSAHAVGTPTWESVLGMDDFVDDALGVNSGSQPYTSGRVGYGFWCNDVTRRAFFDHVEVFKQL